MSNSELRAILREYMQTHELSWKMNNALSWVIAKLYRLEELDDV